MDAPRRVSYMQAETRSVAKRFPRRAWEPDDHNMYQSLGTITLKSGETVEAGVVRGPEPTWAARLVQMLAHKGDPWNWQNAQVLEQDLGLAVNFYLLHRGDSPFASIMTVENRGVGHFGHVWTEPADRQQGASSQLMRLQMQDFVERGGQALFLGTGVDSVPFRMYASFGFRGVEAGSGYMAFYGKSQVEFETAYFAPGPVEIQPLAWPHWPASASLFLGDFPGLIRCAPLRLIGRASTEEPLLGALVEAEQRRATGEASPVLALVNRATAAVVGMAAWGWDPLWPEACLVDCYCHPAYWQHAPDLFSALAMPSAARQVVYVDAGHAAKAEFFARAGFRPIATLPRWVAADALQASWVDVTGMSNRDE